MTSVVPPAFYLGRWRLLPASQPAAPAIDEVANVLVEPVGHEHWAGDAGQMQPGAAAAVESVAGEITRGGDDGEACLFKGSLGAGHVVGGGDEEDVFPAILLC